MQAGKWVAGVIAVAVLFSGPRPAELAAQGTVGKLRAAGFSPANGRRPATSLSPRTLSSRWLNESTAGSGGSVATRSTAADRSPAQIAASLGLPVDQHAALGSATETQATDEQGNAAVITQAVEPVESIPAPASTPASGGVIMSAEEPFEDFTQLPNQASHCSTCQDPGAACWPAGGLDHLSFFGGVQGFKNAGGRGQDGSFGFHEGLNFGTAARNVILPPPFGLQFGFQATHSNLEGANFTTSERNQWFFTAGAFRRAECGLQGGLVFDYLRDDWYYDLSVSQVRGEISNAISGASSYGLWFTAPVKDDVTQSQVSGATVTDSWETMDIYALFFRSSMLAAGRGEGRLYAGLTGDSDGIIGSESRVPLINGWALETEFTYLVPDEPRGGGANEVESWNVAINLVWYPGSLACGQANPYHRPMFDVANNGSLILKRK